jgi:isoleucyl-tRNA synthetase
MSAPTDSGAPPFPAFDTGLSATAEEEQTIAFWRDHDIFRKSMEERPEEKPFVFYEGPPTTNGRPGVHHVLSRTVKDLVCRFWTMEGYKVRRKGGWDTHGLPVEIEVEKELGIEGKDQIEAFGLAEFNARCRKSVFKYKDEWSRITERIGFWLDLDDPYVTLENDYMETVWWVLKRFWDEGLFYAGFKVVPYCPRCQTALSDHEVSQGYKTVVDPSVYVKFPVVDRPDTYILAWTTTPWTLPGNVALAVGKHIDYVKVRERNNGKTEDLYLAKDRLDVLQRPGHEGAPDVVEKLKGADLVGLRYRPLFEGLDLEAETGKRAYYVADADFVTTEDGTGVVHTAVMYGADDYTLGMKIDLPAFHTVDPTGHFTDKVPVFAGRKVREVDPEIIDYLQRQGLLLKREDYEHSYPFCWRCDSALLYYARDSWYLKTTAFKEKMLSENAGVRWFPPQVGKSRFGNWLDNNVDWAISRERFWATPLPIWRCEAPDCAHTLCIGSRKEIAERGAEVPDDLHRPFIDQVVFPCPECDGIMRRIPEVTDVWFDSGSMPFAQWHYPFENEDVFRHGFPADFICEGIDQSRGWFYSLLAIATLVDGRAPYRAVLANGLILDEQGRKMSKRLGNTVDPWEVLGAEGADALRWYLLANSPPWVTTRFVRDGVTEAARKFFGTLRNVASFFATYANVDGWTPPGDPPPFAGRPVLDRWLLARLDAVSISMREDLRSYQVTRAARTLSAFVQDELSNWYVRRSRRRFWKGERGPDKESAYATLHEALTVVARLMAPFAPFLSETLHRGLSVPYDSGAPESVHLAAYPAPDESRRDPALENAMDRALRITELGRAARTQAGIKVRQPLARLLVAGAPKALPGEFLEVIRDEINVKRVEFTNPESLMDARLKPNFKVLGPRFGGEVNRVAAAIKALAPAAVAAGLARASWPVTPEGMEPVSVGGDEVQVETSSREGLVAVEEGSLRVALDVRLDPALEGEGRVRELVHRLQNLRKERGLAITDRVRVRVGADGSLAEATREHKSFIEAELLADDLEIGPPAPDDEAWDIEGAQVTVRLELKQ